MKVAKISAKESLKEFFGFDSFKDEQEKIIDSVIKGEDTFVIMPTGGGKSLCYQLPALMLPGVTIIISPLIALMKNQVDAIRGFSENENVAHFLNSSLSKGEIQQVRRDIQAGKTKMLFVAPESLTKKENIDFLTIDVEGLDFEVLESNNWNKYRPSAVLIEVLASTLADIESSQTFKFLHDKRYILYSKLISTCIFLSEEFAEEYFKNQISIET